MDIIKTQKGALTILTGKSGMGKSTIAVFDAAEQLREGKGVIIFSYEYCQSIFYNKLVSHCCLKWQDLFKLNIVDANGLTFDRLVEAINSRKDNVDVVYIDYLDLLKDCSFARNDNNDAQDLANIQSICKALAKIARELDIAIVLLSQIGSSVTFEETVSTLNEFTSKVGKGDNVIKMFIGKGSVIDPRIVVDDISHIILVEGNNLKHFSTINIKEMYKD